MKPLRWTIYTKTFKKLDIRSLPYILKRWVEYKVKNSWSKKMIMVQGPTLLDRSKYCFLRESSRNVNGATLKIHKWVLIKMPKVPSAAASSSFNRSQNRKQRLKWLIKKKVIFILIRHRSSWQERNNLTSILNLKKIKLIWTLLWSPAY